MPTKKIGDIPDPYKKAFCGHPEHNPPSHMVWPNGIYEHTCPGCGEVQVFTVNRPSWEVKSYEWKGGSDIEVYWGPYLDEGGMETRRGAR